MVSVIIPAHNEAQNLKELLPTLAKDGAPYLMEVIVVVSACNADNTEEICLENKVRCFRCTEMGRAKQMNYGVAMAKGDYYAFLHADVRPPQGFFRDIKATLSAGMDAGFFSYKFDKDSFLLNINSSFTKKDGVFTGGGDQCLFIKASVFKALNGFDPNQVIMEDFEIFRRIKQNNYSYTIIPNNLVVSSRKYETNSYLKVNLSNLLLVILFRMGYPAIKLKQLHSKLLSTPYAATAKQ
ncbi:TIGR04283 family arsenosugar biosynthesis glycosyltransferase [Croceivirga radicis]|uniref:TIGR04283 family arsenosugar biosynthesis glycosyltransferase n=1 Tax=Croceivirga radicis TaxID=1929488 RepID=UPI000255AC64|nr:TIGR04283 family arsenosugar biosynthesis glycosyltransferase [Croceivirga radicis]